MFECMGAPYVLGDDRIAGLSPVERAGRCYDALLEDQKLFDIADAWESERETHKDVYAYMCDTVDILQAKLHDMTADRDKWKRTYKDVPPDVVDGWREVER